MRTQKLILAAVALAAGLCAGQAHGLDSVTSGYWTNTDTWGGWLPGSGDDVVIKGGHTVTIATNTPDTINSLTIEATGVLTHQANEGSELYEVILNVVNNLTINAGGAIDVDTKGYGSGSGPGARISDYGGGSYGGMGGQGGGADGLTYGSITAPTNCGSGATGVSGGGAVILAVGGTATVDGVISAVGQSGGGNRGSGSAGSIFITTGAIAGSGTLRAIGGGSALYGGQGGGGRIAVILTNSEDFGSVSIQAYGGYYSARCGAAGTIYLQKSTDSPGGGELIVDNNNQTTALPSVTTQNGKEASSNAFTRIVLRNAGRYGLDTNDILNITTTVVTGDTDDRNEGFYLNGGTLLVPADFMWTNYAVHVAMAGSSFSPANSLSVGANADLIVDQPHTVNCPVDIQAGGILKHTPNTTAEAYKIDLTVHGNLDIQAGGEINVQGRGYFDGGLGKPLYVSTDRSGAGHGGEGGERAVGEKGTAYGSITAPTNIGSSGYHPTFPSSGGGCVILRVDGTTTVNGPINVSANGGSGRGCGSGGSIYLTTGILSGTNTISANGGAPPVGQDYGACGAGGRIAVILTNSTDFGSVGFQARTGDYGAQKGAAGTIYLKTSAQPEGYGTLLVDAMNYVPDTSYSPITTLISSKVTDTTVGTVIITNKAVLTIATNRSLTVNRDWDNQATFVAMTNSAVAFAGTNAATILTSTSNVFYHLVCTNAGKVLCFQDGKTNIVNGVLTLANVTVNSTSGSVSWYLKASAFTHSVSNVTAGHSDARPGSQITAYDSTDLGGNSNWVFTASGPQTNRWTGTTDTNWANGGNWSQGRPTVETDDVIIPGGCLYYPLLDFDKRVKSLAISNGASLNLAGYNLTVDEALRSAGTLTVVGAPTVTVGGNLDFSGGGVFTAACSTVRLVGTNAQSAVSAGNAFYQLTADTSAAPVLFTDAVVATNILNLGRPITFLGAVTVTSALQTQGTNVTFGDVVTAATFRNANGSLVFSGPLTAQAFYSENGALVFSGAVAAVSFTNWGGDLTFRDDVSSVGFYSAPGGMTHTFQAGKTVTIGNLELYGRGGYPIQLRGSAGSAWYLNVTNLATVRLVDVQYSDASGGQTIRPLASADGGSNTNWVFGGPWQAWAGTVETSFTNANNWSPTGTPGESTHVLIDGYGTTAPILSGVATAAQVIVGGGITTATLTVNGNLTTREDVEILPNGTITHSANNTTEAYKLYLTVGGNLTILGQINVDGRGYASGGPGVPIPVADDRSGAGHGGEGGEWSYGERGTAYGSITAPTNVGSSCLNSGAFPSSGGGCAILRVDGTTVVTGFISACANLSGGRGGGSGGSIYLTTGALTGSGTLRANGGAQVVGQDYGGCGAGGRIAVILTNSTSFDAVAFQARSGDYGGTKAAAGTIYLRTAVQPEGQGTLLVDAMNLAPNTNVTTLVNSKVTGTTVGTAIVTNQAVVRVESNQTLMVNGHWIVVAGGSFSAATNSTVEFAGTDAAAIYTNNTFFNLTCTNAGKTLVFEAGRTNTVAGLLKLGAAHFGQFVTLQSTVGGSWSYLTLTPGGTQQIARVNVKDNNAGGGQTLLVSVGSVNGGNNINWQFPPSGTMIVVK